SRLRVLASRLRLAQLLRPREQGMRWAGMEMFTERRVAADDRRLDPVYAAYRANLGRIVDAARGAGASVLLCTVAVNLRDCPPFAGEAAGEAFAAGRLDEARDLDELRFRADSRMSGIVKEVASARPGDVRLIDIERTFNRAGDDLFVDHVHFTPAGSYKLGMSIAEIAMHDLGARMEDSGRIPSLDDCLDRMLYTPWNELDVTDAMLVRYGRPPFSSQPGHAAHRGSLASRRLVLREEIAARDLAQERSRFEAAMAATPEDWRLPAQWGEILLNAGLYDEAEEHLRRVLEALPHRIEMLGGLAMVLGYAGRADEGAQLFAQLPAKAHALAVEHLLQLSRSMMEDRRVAEAEAFASVALKLEPEDADVQFELAREHLALGRMEEAEKELQRLVDRWPDHTPARNELSAVLAKGKRWAEADAVLLRGVQDVDTQLKRVQLKMGAGDMDAAGEQLRALESSGAEPGPVYMTRGIWHMIRREPDLAIAAYTKSLEARPDARTYFDLARAQVQAGRAADARASLKAALELDPGNSACVALLKELGMP
ncbi:MAG TPA: tetratricopeptide repeat protein, partial [Kiritimatiellia bacterium]